MMNRSTQKKQMYNCGGKVKAKKMASGGQVRGCGAARKPKSLKKDG